jgi:exodeoxyribonuclease (lambda-induced)
VTFKYLDAPQGSPEWVEARVGKVTASRLKDWLAVSKRDGKPLKARLDYERELAFEVEFKVPFERFVTNAMLQGQEMEEFLKRQYEKEFDVIVKPTGAYYSDSFVASPDGEIGTDGLIECKWVYDTTFSEVLTDGVKEDHMLQIQGQLWASNRKWCDYVVGNGHTGKYVVIRVERDEKMIKAIADGVAHGKLSVWVKSDNVFDFTEQPKLSSITVDEEF